MDASKIRNYIRNHSGAAFPKFRALSTSECERIRTTLGRRLGLPRSDAFAILKNLENTSECISSINTETAEFDLKDVLVAKGIAPGNMVYLSWHLLDEIDEIRFDDLCKFFHDIWYPASDDLEILDVDLNWIAFVFHHGEVRMARLPYHV